MMALDFFQEMLFTIRQNKLRTALTAFSVFWGVFTLVILLSCGTGFQNGVFKEFGTDVRDFIFIDSGLTSVDYKGSGIGRLIDLEENDVLAIKQGIKNTKFVASESRSSATVKYGDKAVETEIYGVSSDYFEIKSDLLIKNGRKLSYRDEQAFQNVALIGLNIKERILDSHVNPIGKLISINNSYFTIIGVFYDKANHGRDSDRVYTSSASYKKIFGSTNTINSIWLTPLPGKDGFEVEERVMAFLKKRHNVSEEDRTAITSFNMAGPVKNITSLFTGINIFLWFVGLGTLAAGVMGVSNIMVITVSERRREIGIRKAMGETPGMIIWSLLLESILLTGLAGYLGLVCGIGLMELVMYALNFMGIHPTFFDNPIVNFQVITSAIILLTLSGSFAGLVPAIYAARITPIDAMRYE